MLNIQCLRTFNLTNNPTNIIIISEAKENAINQKGAKMQKIIEAIKRVWHNEDYTERDRIIIIICGVLLAFAIVFGFYCFVGWILWFLYNAIASAYNWPSLNYWFFVIGSFAFRIITNPPRREKEGQ